MKKDLADRLGPARPSFLLLPPVCVLLGYAVARWEGAAVEPVTVILALIGAIAAHVSVNAFNEYSDYKSGLDAITTRTPFSGGSGTLQRRPELAGWALALAVGSLLVTAAIGLYFTFTSGWGILPIGIAGVLVIVTYAWAVRHPIVCLVAPGLGFGTCMVIGTHYVCAGHYSWAALVASLVPFFLVSNLLLLNQFPDVEADKKVGRSNIIIAGGRQSGAVVYMLFTLFAYCAIVAGVLLVKMPLLSLIGLATLALSIPAIVGAFRNNSNIPKLIPSLGLNVVTNLLTPLLLGIGVLAG